MDLHKLRIFVAIARQGGFTKAAEQLFMTQPTVSQQLALLESALKTQLIDRSTRKLHLTPPGEALLPYAEQILALSETAAEAARAAAGVADRTLRIGVGSTLATYLLPDLLRRYKTLYPERQTRITLGNTAELLDLLD